MDTDPYQPPHNPSQQQPPYPQQPPTQYPPQGYPQQPYYPPPPMMPPPQPKKKSRTWLWIVLGVIALVIFACIGSQLAGKGSQTTSNTLATQPASQSNPTQASQSTPTHTASFAQFGDGTYQVGKDIQPGTYRTRVGSPGCYYARLKGFSGSIDDIISNDNTDAPAVVTIKASDKGFMSQNCGTWTTDLSQITSSKTSFDDGIFIVGTDITPGTYKDSGGDSCYFARLRGFGGTIDDIITNNNVSAPTIVTISSSDKGIQSRGCGTWKKL